MGTTMSYDRGKRFKSPLPENWSSVYKHDSLTIRGDLVTQTGNECATILASGLIPIQLEYYYFEFCLKELGEGAEVIIGCQIHGHELDQAVGDNTCSFGMSTSSGTWF